MAVALGSRSALRLRLLLSQLKPGIRVSRAGPAAAFGTSVTSAKVAVNGVHLHYQRTGEGEHAVLLLPGMLGLDAFMMLPRAVWSLGCSHSAGCQGLFPNSVLC